MHPIYPAWRGGATFIYISIIHYKNIYIEPQNYFTGKNQMSLPKYLATKKFHL